MVDKPADDRVDAAIAALNTVRRDWLRRPGVTAVDVGLKITDGELTDTLALRAHVARKLPAAELADSEVFTTPDTPNEVQGFPVDVIEASYGPSTTDAGPVVLEDAAPEAVNRRGRVRPVIGGVSCGNPRVTAGTVGAIVYDRATCRAMILSNFHVLAGSRSAAAGEPIYQPGVADGGTSADRVAALHRFRLDSSMDAAVARFDSGVDFDREELGIGTISGTVAASIGMPVTKSGRTTGVTVGLIDGLSMSVTINYGAGIGAVTLNDQVHIVPRPPWPSVDYEVSMGGDSGSVWLEESTRRAVGLHFAGETDPTPASENAICTPIARVVAEFNISFLPVLCRPIRPFDLCTRYPAVCRFLAAIARDPWPPIPGGFPPGGGGPVPGDPVFRLPQSAGESPGCSGCGGGGTREGAGDADFQRELAAFLRELGA